MPIGHRGGARCARVVLCQSEKNSKQEKQTSWRDGTKTMPSSAVIGRWSASLKNFPGTNTWYTLCSPHASHRFVVAELEKSKDSKHAPSLPRGLTAFQLRSSWMHAALVALGALRGAAEAQRGVDGAQMNSARGQRAPARPAPPAKLVIVRRKRRGLK